MQITGKKQNKMCDSATVIAQLLAVCRKSMPAPDTASVTVIA